MGTVAQSCAGVDPGGFTAYFIGALNVPGPVKSILYLIETSFWIGRKIRNWVFMVENPQLTVFGAFLNEQLSTNSFVRVVAQVVHLARIITDFGRKAEDFARSVWRLTLACLTNSLEVTYFGTEFAGRDWTYIRGSSPEYLASPWPVSYAKAKIQQIFTRVVEMLYAAYEVSYALFELHEAVSLDLPEGAVGLLPAELSRLGETFMGREWDVSRSVMEYEEVIDRMFAATLLPWSTRRLAETLQSISTGARVINVLMQGPSMISQKVKEVIPQNSR